MRVIINAQFLLASALYIAQIMQIYGNYLVDVKYDYEILEMNEYISLEEKEDKSHGNGKFIISTCNFTNVNILIDMLAKNVGRIITLASMTRVSHLTLSQRM